MWLPDDPDERRWRPSDGLLKLIDTAVVHLFKELYWRETGEWLGDEAPHHVPGSKRRRAVRMAKSQSPKASVRVRAAPTTESRCDMRNEAGSYRRLPPMSRSAGEATRWRATRSTSASAT